jgi:hypothetical protein
MNEEEYLLLGNMSAVYLIVVRGGYLCHDCGDMVST